MFQLYQEPRDGQVMTDDGERRVAILGFVLSTDPDTGERTIQYLVAWKLSGRYTRFDKPTLLSNEASQAVKMWVDV
jgi:hypothetical protein